MGQRAALESTKAPQLLNASADEPGQVALALPPPLCPSLSPPLCLSLFPCLFPPFLHSTISFPELLICTKWVNLFASILGRDSEMRLGICVCDCVRVTLCTRVSVHACLCPRVHICVSSCVFAGVCVGHRTHLSQTSPYLLPSENPGKEGSCPGVWSSCI